MELMTSANAANLLVHKADQRRIICCETWKFVLEEFNRRAGALAVHPQCVRRIPLQPW